MSTENKSPKIIKTIYDEDVVEDFSEESDDEVNVSGSTTFSYALLTFSFQFQPSKQKNKNKTDFDTNFQFVSTVDEYNTNVWDDLTKYVKRKAKSKTDDKIKKARQKIEENVEGNNIQESDVSLSDSELQFDAIKIKSRKRKRDEEFFEEPNAYDDSISFYQMNLSRPLMKAIGDMKFVHPTPIQAATIPAALLGSLTKCYVRLCLILVFQVKTFADVLLLVQEKQLLTCCLLSNVCFIDPILERLLLGF